MRLHGRPVHVIRYDDLNTMEGTSIVIHISTDTDNGNGISIKYNHISIQRLAPDGAYAALGHNDGSVNLWDLKHLRKIPMSGNCAAVACTAVMFNREYAAAGTDKKITIWNLVDGVQSAVLTGPVANMTYATFSPDGRFAYAATDDDFVHYWDLASGYTHNVIKRFPLYKQQLVVSLDGQYLRCNESVRNEVIAYNRDNSIALSDYE